jgi:hypothetical protein
LLNRLAVRLEKEVQPASLRTGANQLRKFSADELAIHCSPYFTLQAHAKPTIENRWNEKAGLRRDAVRSQVIDVLEAQEIKETGNEKG